ncbi:MAG: pantoate--beta-alanine ligase [Bacteroidales bacterium]|nr:pantoate--beta-alanine ligase [Bacteroidales bacterium]
MIIIKTRKEISEKIIQLKKEGKTIGFVPTMGALHQGHLSLIEIAQKHTDVSVVSLFVNPTQFNNSKDLEKYPRTIETDIDKLQSVCTDILFLPNADEMYPEEDTRVFDFGKLDKVMEGKYRSGHFNGVAQIVSKLFESVLPDKAFFGLKDFQQYVIIKELVKKFMPDTDIEIVGCPIIREKGGLAMSSRNELLGAVERENANIISKVLEKSKEIVNEKSVEEIKKYVVAEINSNSFLKVEYFEIVDDVKLENIKNWSENNKKVGCVAVFCGEVRLIDNVYYN